MSTISFQNSEPENLDGLIARSGIDPGHHAAMENIERKVIGLVRTILGTEEVYSIGSSQSKTYLPTSYGIAEDIDLYILGDHDLLESTITLGRERDSISQIVEKALGIPNLTVKLNSAEENDAGGYRQAMISIVEKHSGKSVLRIDLNYSQKDDGALNYRKKFGEQVDSLVSGLSLEDKEAGREYILSQIRAMKRLMVDHHVYKPQEGGLRGMGVEQAILTLYSRHITGLEDLKEKVNVGEALKRIHEHGKDYHLPHPLTGEQLTDKLWRKNEGVSGWEKLLELASMHLKFQYTGAKSESWSGGIQESLRLVA